MGGGTLYQIQWELTWLTSFKPPSSQNQLCVSFRPSQQHNTSHVLPLSPHLGDLSPDKGNKLRTLIQFCWQKKRKEKKKINPAWYMTLAKLAFFWRLWKHSAGRRNQFRRKNSCVFFCPDDYVTLIRLCTNQRRKYKQGASGLLNVTRNEKERFPFLQIKSP